MNHVFPPTDPAQLPPRTDDFLFCNASSLPVGAVQFSVNGPAGPDHALIPAVPPGTTAMAHGQNHLEEIQVACDADVDGLMYHWEFDEVPPGMFVSKVICGIQDEYAPEGGTPLSKTTGDERKPVIPWGVVVLVDGAGANQTVAFNLQ